MVRRRTAALTAAAVLVTTPLLASCGTPHAGTAAVVEGEQISVSALQTKVDAVRTAQEQAPQAAQLIESGSRLPSVTLNNMVVDRVLDKAAGQAGITVSRRETQQMRRSLEKQFGGPEALETQLLTQYHTAPSDIDDFCRTQAVARKLARSMGLQPGTDDANAAVGKKLAETAGSMGIDVNPRYGRWDAEQLALGPAEETWVTDVTKSAAGA